MIRSFTTDLGKGAAIACEVRLAVNRFTAR